MSFVIERMGRPTGTRARRVQRFERERAVDRLGGRTLWCGGGLEEHLGWTRPDGVVTAPLGGQVAPSARAGDVVVLDRPHGAPLVRDCGAHALWHRESGSAPVSWPRGLDAYLISRPGMIAAVVPAAGLGFAKRVDGEADDLAWASLLADVLECDRLECVGGTVRVRPVVAAR
jgi:hypothetical protein